MSKISYAAIMLGLFIFAAGAFAQCPIDSIYNAGAGDKFGSKIATSGDINNDGYDDIAVSDHDSDMVYVYSGQTMALLYELTGSQSGEHFGYEMFIEGDVNNDSFDDLVISGYYYKPASKPLGRIYIFSGQDGELIRTITGDGIHQSLGITMACAGDVDNDGCDDIIAGTFGRAAYVYSGQTGNILRTITIEQTGSFYPLWVDGGSDINQDGYLDFLIGDPGNVMDTQNRGDLFVYSSEDGELIMNIIGGEGSANSFGFYASVIGQVDSDIYTDLAAVGQENNQPYIFIYSGATGNEIFKIPFNGVPLSDAGDIDKDGHDDILGLNKVFSGYDGSLLYDCGGGGSFIGADIGDVNNDDYPEMISDIYLTAESDSLDYSTVIVYSLFDIDCDGLYDDQDICTDTDGDGFGDPGFPDNTCILDNCPEIYNPGQEDTDGDGTGDSCDTCYDIVFKLGTDIIFMEGTTTDGIGEIGEITFEMKMTSWMEDCFYGDSIHFIDVEIYYDSNLLVFDGGTIDTNNWKGDYNIGDNPGYLGRRVVVDMYSGSAPFPEDFTTFFTLRFKARCQPDMNENALHLDNVYHCCQVYTGRIYQPTEYIDGSVVTIMGENSCYYCGNFNNDEALNILDIIAFVNYLYKDGPPPFIEEAADVNSSGGIDIIDITDIINYLYRGGAELNCQ